MAGTTELSLLSVCSRNGNLSEWAKEPLPLVVCNPYTSISLHAYLEFRADDASSAGDCRASSPVSKGQ